MRYLIYSEVPLELEPVRSRLEQLAVSAVAHVLVPVKPVNEQQRQFLEAEMSPDHPDQPPAVVFADWLLRDAINALSEAGFEQVTGATAEGSAVDAIESAVEAGGHDVVVVVTEPTGVAGWVHLDLPHRIERHIDQPVIHMEVEPVR